MKEKDQGLRLHRLRIGFPSQITANKDSQEEDVPLDGTCLRDKTNKLKVCAAVVSTSRCQRLSSIYVYEQ